MPKRDARDKRGHDTRYAFPNTLPATASSFLSSAGSRAWAR